MSLCPVSANHALQIAAGVKGRHSGRSFERELQSGLAALPLPAERLEEHSLGDLSQVIVDCWLREWGWERLDRLTVQIITGSKSDLWVTAGWEERSRAVGVSVKACSLKQPTNMQVHFTTAQAFCRALRGQGMAVSAEAEVELRKFCGEDGYRPLDANAVGRLTDPRRWFWEELTVGARSEWSTIWGAHQELATKLVLCGAVCPPEYLVHRVAPGWVVVVRMSDLVAASVRQQGFAVKPYRVVKGRYPDPPGVWHEAPRFGIIQCQRAGQQQHPAQLQFNLQSRYFAALGLVLRSYSKPTVL